MKADQDSVLKTISRYSLSNFYRQALGLLTAFIRPKFLNPEMYGLWNLLNILVTFSSHTHLGSRSALRYRIPQLEAQNDTGRLQEIKGAVFYGSLYLNLGFAALVVIYACKPGLAIELRLGLLITAAVVILTGLYEYQISLLKGSQNFRLVSAINYVRATATFVFSLVLIYFFGIYGALGGVLLALLTGLVFLARQPSGAPAAPCHWPIFWDAVRQGLPIILFNLVAVLLRTVDKLVISLLLGNQQLGYYGIATMVLGSLLNIPGVSREVIEPRLLQGLDQTSAASNFSEYFLKPSLATAYLMPLLLGPVVFLLPVVIPALLPQYTAGIQPAQIMVLGAYFLALSYPGRGLIVAYNWLWPAAWRMATAVAVNLVLSVMLVKAGYGINGVAAASGISFLVLAAILFVFIMKNVGLSWTGHLPRFIYLLVPFPVMCLAIYGLSRCTAQFTVNPYLALAIQLPLFLAVHLSLIGLARTRNVLSRAPGEMHE